MKIVAITSCSTGIAHTYMAAENLEMAAKEKGYEIKVETQGSIGAENVLSDSDIEAADAVVIAASTTVNKERFYGKKLIEVDVNEAINDGPALLERSLTAPVYQMTNGETQQSEKVQSKGIYSHLMTGVSYMIPFVVAGGLCIALAFAFGGINSEGALAQAINELGGIAMGLMWPILGGYVAFSIADRPGLVPGMVAGMVASSMNAGFLGALLGGFLAGYTILLLKKLLKLPAAFSGLLPVLILPVLSVLIVGGIMKFIVGVPITAINEGIMNWLNSLTGINSVLLGLILGAMMAIDLAGPVGKAAYFFGVASLTNLAVGETSTIMAAVMVSGMVPPLAMALSSTILGKQLYTSEEREAGKSAWVLGLSFISEGAIPFAAADPLRVLGSVTIGSAITGALSMFFNCGIAVPHGGFFVFLIPGAVSNVLLYIIALVIGTAISGFLVTAIKIAGAKKREQA
ncbi:PTS system fructose-specific IIC component [Enterococcus sp. PF1-24]|uniref:PTS fructose transporter subunit IIC n=1 Tax=unclassified Enterococcus TaxID=2608891 RepID=UPI0024740575|nr:MULTISPECIES: fructose-specific PTS transporter subunit EIIC [unclassified Enterococcus]MDH6364009.1 PTS system fructose-specific IIC component [Enterococcus sp. PFB1-1]MDH6401110.1 PTS system fructose-specific IIC component [Enterococcus sp. PF1-24]